ncbi:MAG TPA: IclR family transcriptional regulator [Caulobacterales bacterium]|nr:IclR family transcriptional regulator [Caulobacterales bacterium]
MAKAIYKAPALDKGLEIIELLAGQPAPMAMPEIAQRLGRSKTEIYRMLVVLEGRGYIRRGEHDDRYRITSRLFELGMRNPPMRNLHDAALPVMLKLAEQSQQSCHLGVIVGDDDQVVIVARVESPAAVGFSVRVGYRVSVVNSASARVIFGAQPDARQAELMRIWRARKLDHAALDDFTAGSAEAAKRGYLLEPSRMAGGIRDIGAPVYDGEALGAVAGLITPYIARAASGPSIDDVVTLTVEAAQSISDRLKHG